MSNNLSQIEKLVLKGHFKRSEKAKKETIKDLDLSKLSAEQQKILDFMNQDFEFEVKIFEFDSDSGLFIAKGNDIFGKSIISGTIKYRRKIDFKKQYIGEPRHKFPVQRANIVDYSGQMKISSHGTFKCAGTYEAHKLETGTWELKSFDKVATWLL